MIQCSSSFTKFILASLLVIVTTNVNSQSAHEKDKIQIIQIRKGNNKAIKEYDLAAETKHYMDDYTIALGRGGLISGKQNYIKRYTGVIGYPKTPTRHNCHTLTF